MRTPSINALLEASISTERLERYREACGGDLDRSLSLYEKNMLLSESLYLPLQVLEISLRNKVDAAMSHAYGENWLLDPAAAPLTDHSRKMINDAISMVGERVRHGKVVAEAKFAFWVGLIAKGYDQTLWRRATHSVFRECGPVRRGVVHGRLNAIRRLRNRIAHHEPIFHKNVEQQYREIVEATAWMCRSTANWSAHHSRTLGVLARYE